MKKEERERDVRRRSFTSAPANNDDELQEVVLLTSNTGGIREMKKKGKEKQLADAEAKLEAGVACDNPHLCVWCKSEDPDGWDDRSGFRCDRCLQRDRTKPC